MRPPKNTISAPIQIQLTSGETIRRNVAGGGFLVYERVRRSSTFASRSGASPASIALHRSLGFEEIGLMKGAGYKHGRWLDTMLMQRRLGEGAETHPDPEAYPGTLFKG